MFKGYFQLGGVEVINSERTYRYVRQNLPQFPLADCVDCDETLHQALGDEAYQSPLADDAPWVDSHNPATQGFYGFYPLELTGSIDDTTVASVTEGLLAGGYVGASRAASREMRYRGLMIARDQLSLHAGMTWLKAALHPAPCQAHGGSCSGATACMYVACPQIEVCYETEPVRGEPIPIGTVATTSPFTHLFANAGLTRAWFTGPYSDGFAVKWGSRYTDGSGRWYEQRGPIVMRRRNFLINPSFTEASLAGWTRTGAGTLTRVATGGVDGGAYANLNPTTASTRRFNWVGEPSFESPTNPESLGWSSNALGGIQQVAAAGVPQGGHYAAAEWDPVQLSLWLAGTVNEPDGQPNRVVSFWAGQSGHALLVELLGTGDTVVATQTFTAAQLTAPWQRLSVANAGTTQVVRVKITQVDPDVAPEPVRVDGFMAEPGAVPTAYFDGNTPDTGTVDYAWVGGDVSKGSVATTITTDTFVLRSADTATSFGNIIASFYLRSGTDPGLAKVKAELVSVDDGTILGTANYDLTGEWIRYSVTSTFGRNVYLRLTGSRGQVQVDQTLIETGVTLWPYFDGGTASFDPFAPGQATPETGNYRLEWTGTPQTSQSVMTWVGAVNPEDPTQIMLALDEVCDEEWQAVLEAVAGRSSGAGVLNYEVRAAIPAATQATPFERNFHDVAATSGPLEIGEYAFTAGAAVEVEFTVVAGTPFAYGSTETLIDRSPVSELPTTPWVDVACAVPDLSPILDPDCPPLPTPPRPPAIPNLCVTDPDLWQRYSLRIPGEKVSGWSQMLPTVLLTTKAQDVRDVRVRITPNPFDWPLTGGQRTNRATNPHVSGTGEAWSQLAGTGVRVGTGGPDGGAFWQTTASAAHAAQGFGPASLGAGYNLVTAGQRVTISAYATGTTGKNAQLRYTFLNAADAVVGAAAYGPSTTMTAGTWKRLSAADLLVPATAVRMSVGVVNVAVAAIGDLLSASMVLLEATSTLDGYFDGNTVDAGGSYHNWVGMPGLSESIAVRTKIDPCAYCSEFILSYLPPNAELTVDALTKSAFASIAGGPAKPASHLLYGTDGTPMTWPELSCGIPYIVTFDVAPADVANVSVSLSLTQQE